MHVCVYACARVCVCARARVACAPLFSGVFRHASSFEGDIFFTKKLIFLQYLKITILKSEKRLEYLNYPRNHSDITCTAHENLKNGHFAHLKRSPNNARMCKW